MDKDIIDKGKIMAVISYITFIGLVIAFVVNNEKDNAFTKFHLGQSFRIVILVFANFALSRIVPESIGFIPSIIGLGIFVLAVLGIVNAANGKTKKLPVIGSIGK